jgi:esterase/lipase superfamily enzyme
MGDKTDRPAVARIILGSVPPELGPERAAVERALTRLRESALPGLEWVSFNDDDITGATPVEVARCQIYIGLLAGHGSTIHFAPEYGRAMQHDLHCLVYIKVNPTAAPERRPGKTKPPPAPSSFADELIRSGAAVPFSGPDDLEAKSTADLNRWLSEHNLDPRPEYAVRPEVPQDATSDFITGGIHSGNRNRVTRGHGAGTFEFAAGGHRPKRSGRDSSKGLKAETGFEGYSADASLPRVYPVWYGTNRRHSDPSDPSAGFSGQRENQDVVHHGKCLVAIPKSHRFGSVGSAWWKRWLTWTDDRLRIVQRDEIAREAFWKAIRGELAQGGPDEQQALVYLHGFNVSFDEAAIRAAQIGFDLKVPGAMAFFSWPSRGALKGYAADAASIEASEAAIADFLVRLATDSGAARVHVIAHSMGNRGLLRAIQRITAQAASTAGIRFGQVFLAAPDLDVGLFRDLAALYPKVSERTTLYVSAQDRALEASHWIHQFDRVGYAPPVTVVDGIDTIEVTGLDLSILGHGYFAEAHGVLYDMHHLLRQNTAPGSRLRLHAKRNPDGRPYWVIA